MYPRVIEPGGERIQGSRNPQNNIRLQNIILLSITAVGVVWTKEERRRQSKLF